MVRYYSNIVGKYGIPVQNALKKLAGIHIDYICSTHGPVWHENVEKVVNLYDRMSKYETDPGLVICYGTMYGNTEDRTPSMYEYIWIKENREAKVVSSFAANIYLGWGR
uniref:tetracycline resistance NADPH-dependent oxidoreductase Tet(37) n=1 Tax=uncultured bacterium TaxID=77133 RepID=UPI000005D6E7|nr:tetracycline resistance NADPH-dependent oxidoreductase Tet(37) [uncultured bacterium]AAN28721.1 tetracycline resistance protein Tet37 [uncultured bacterium]